MEAEQNQPLTLTLTPPQISLRPFTPSSFDIDALISLSSDRINRFLRRGPFSDRAAALRFLYSHILPHPFYRAICLPAGPPVGSISLRPAPSGDRGPRAASLAYRVAVPFWGRGIATAAVRIAAAAAFEEWGELERVEAVADAENLASQRVLEKAGFKREALLRRYMVLKGEVVSSAKKFRYCDIDLELEAKLDTMFSGVVATGEHVWAPTVDLSRNDDEIEKSQSFKANEEALPEANIEAESSRPKRSFSQET